MSCPPSPTPSEFWGQGGIAERIWEEEQRWLLEAAEAAWDEEEERKKRNISISPTEPWPPPRSNVGAVTGAKMIKDDDDD